MVGRTERFFEVLGGNVRVAPTAAIAVVLGVAVCAGVGFSDCGCSGGSSSLVWLSPSGSPVPAAHTFIGCAESGKNTPKLVLTASNLGPGDGCQFSAKLANVGAQALTLTEVTQESTPVGQPTFASCFSFSLSSGPPGGKLAAGGTYGYTFTVGELASATSLCEKVVGTVLVTFTGTTTVCKNSG